MNQFAVAAVRRRISVAALMSRNEPYRCRLNRLLNLFPLSIRTYQ